MTHLEPLFATCCVIGEVEETFVSRAAIVTALEEAAVRAPARAGQGWYGACSSVPLDALGDVIAQLASRMTIDTRSGLAKAKWAFDHVGLVSAAKDVCTMPLRYDAFWRAVYVADDGYSGSIDDAAGGELLMEDPRLPGTMMEWPQLRLRLGSDTASKVYEPEIAMRPVTGSVFLMPGWLRIAQRPFYGCGKRMLVLSSLIAPLERSSNSKCG